MSRFLSLKLLATNGSKSRAVTRIRAVVATGAGPNLLRHFSLSQALGVNLVEPIAINFNRNPPGQWHPNDPSHNNPGALPSIAVILSGCGMKDGTDVQEAVYTMMHISRLNLKPTCFAPNDKQLIVVDHVLDQAYTDRTPKRHMTHESARITWDGCKLLDKLNVEDHYGLIIPSGLGVGLNLTDYYRREPGNMHLFKMDKMLKDILLDFYRHEKPIGFLGLASILAARLFQGVRITFGDEETLRKSGTDYLIKHAMLLNARHEVTPFYRVFHDMNYNIFSARASLAGPSLKYHELSIDIGNLVDAVALRMVLN